MTDSTESTGSSTSDGKNEEVPDGSGHGSSESEEDTASGGPASS